MQRDNLLRDGRSRRCRAARLRARSRIETVKHMRQAVARDAWAVISDLQQHVTAHALQG